METHKNIEAMLQYRNILLTFSGNTVELCRRILENTSLAAACLDSQSAGRAAQELEECVNEVLSAIGAADDAAGRLGAAAKKLRYLIDETQFGSGKRR